MDSGNAERGPRGLPFDAVNREALARARTLLPVLLPGGSWQGAEWVTKNPKRDDTKPGSLSINSSTGKWKDFSSSEGGADLVSLHAWVNGTGQGDACKALAHDFGINTEVKAQAAPVAPRYPRPILPVPEGVPALARRPNEQGRWEYRDDEGRLLLVRVRTPDPVKEKAVITYTWCETGPGMAEWRPKAPEHPWPLFGLDRMAQRPAARVLVGEGEKTALAAEQVFPEMVAVTSGSADSAAGADWNALAGRDVTIWPDADDPGAGYAVKVAALLEGVAAAVRLVPLPEAITAWVKPGKDKPGGWDLADPVPAGVDLRDVLAAAKLLESSKFSEPRKEPGGSEDLAALMEWPEPQPLTSKLGSAPYPVDALPQTVRAAVREVLVFVQAPVPLVASSALAALFLAIQAHKDMMRAEKLSGPVGLFLLTIADSGERKSTCDGFFSRAIREYEAQQAEAAKPLLADYQADLDGWEARQSGIKHAIRAASKACKNTQVLESKLRDLEHEKPWKPRVPRLIYGDATPEALTFNLAKVWPSGGVVSAEAGNVFGAHGMGRDSIMRNLATLDLLWDGATIATERRTSESYLVRGARLTIALQVQESTLRAFLKESGDLARGIGFLARCLVARPESTQGSRPFMEAPTAWPHLAAFNRRIASILDRPAPIDLDGALSPGVLTFKVEAKAAWVAFHDRVERELGDGGTLRDVRDVASKIADNAARMAALFHVFEDGPGDAVGVEHFQAAAQITEWHLNEARRFFGELALPGGVADAGRLEAWLIDRCQRNGLGHVPNMEIQQFGPRGLRGKAQIDEAMAVLEELGRAQRLHEGKRKFIAVNPALLHSQGVAIAIPAIPAIPKAPIPWHPSLNSQNSQNSNSHPSGVESDVSAPAFISGDGFTVDL